MNAKKTVIKRVSAKQSIFDLASNIVAKDLTPLRKFLSSSSGQTAPRAPGRIRSTLVK